MCTKSEIPTPIADFIAEIEEERVNQELSKVALSMKAFGNRSTYSQLTTGKRNVGIKSYIALAEALGMKLVICIMEKEE